MAPKPSLVRAVDRLSFADALLTFAGIAPRRNANYPQLQTHSLDHVRTVHDVLVYVWSSTRVESRFFFLERLLFSFCGQNLGALLGVGILYQHVSTI
jgi:hypothetical protein